MNPRAPRPFVFVLHNHQPVGNFEHVFEESFARCYGPVLDRLAEHPGVKAGLHYSGPLLEWLADHRPKYLDRIAELVSRGQVEVLGGGFYEPILSVLPDRDAVGQIVMMSEFCRERFGRAPTGMWLAERVWDPDLPRVLSSAGIRYTLLDDTHFRAGGVTDDVLSGWYETEKAGDGLAIFPIDKGLRYRIPFAAPEEVVEYIERAPGTSCLTYGDDGEKFGVWPDTFDWVFEKRWLDRFFCALEEAEENGRVATLLPGEVITSHPARGRVYLPNASYDEMMEWALPSESMHRFHELRERLRASGDYDRYGPFLRGGIWQSFLSKYPEANRIHKKMLEVSVRLSDANRAAGDASSPAIGWQTRTMLDDARRELYRGQCCCAYWHGLFGGLYLNYLRAALYRSVLGAERILDSVQHAGDERARCDVRDFDVDGSDEVRLANVAMDVYLSPRAGATAYEIDFKPACFNIADVLTRREEGYHRKIAAAGNETTHSGEGPKSIHDLVRMKEEGLADVLVYDTETRASFLDRFVEGGTTLDAFRSSSVRDLGDFSSGIYALESIERLAGGSCGVRLARTGSVDVCGTRRAVRIDKYFELAHAAAVLSVRWALENRDSAEVECELATELNLTLLAASDPSRWLSVDDAAERFLMGSSGTFSAVRRVAMIDEWSKMRVSIEFDREPRVDRYPIETVSQSENGFERTYQGTCFVIRTPFRLRAGERTEISMRISIASLAS